MEERNLFNDLTAKIKSLNETVWEGRASRESINIWLDNFANEEERLHALYLLSQFMYFGSTEIRELLVALFRDHIKYRILESIRKENDDTTDLEFINSTYQQRIKATKIMGMGNPSESGPYLLYFLRQENNLPNNLFCYSFDLLYRESGTESLRYPDTIRYVFVDDFCGSGSQAARYSNSVVGDIKSLSPESIIDYVALFATENGIEYVKDNARFDYVGAVFEIDDSYKAFNDASRIFSAGYSSISKTIAREMSERYGKILMRYVCENWGCPPHHIDACSKDNALGFKDGQLLLGFNHNTPDNTLPIFWADQPNWHPMFRRYDKVYK
jgi:hypothetical protein